MLIISTGIQSGSNLHSPNFLLTKKPPPIEVVTEIRSFSPIRTNKVEPNPLKITSSSSSLTLEESNLGDKKQGKKNPGVLVKPPESSRLVLKFIWMEKKIGIALDQVIPGGHGTIPLSPYYFWPRKDAWEELKVMMERKPWISTKQMVVLLNQATDIINLWQQSGVSGDSA